MDLQAALIKPNDFFGNVYRGMTDDMQRCVQSCTYTHQICLQTLLLSLEKSPSEPNHIRALIDCAKLCSLASDFLIRSSDMLVKACELCENACLVCAESCEQQVEADEVLSACAEACRQCAELCRNVASLH